MAISGADVRLFDRNTTTPARATTTTNSSGFWTISHGTEGRFDIETQTGSSKRRRKYDDAIQVTEIETANLLIRNPADTFKYDIVPAAIVADRALNLPLLTETGTLVVTPSTLDMTFNDNVKLTLGTGGDADLYYDAANVIMDTAVVGSGIFALKGATNAILGASSDGDLIIHPNILTDEATERDLQLQVLDANANAFIRVLRIQASVAVPAAVFAAGFNVHVGTTGIVLRGTTQPTNAINIFNGTAPAGNLTNGVTLYAGAGELNVMDATGNITLLSPHDKETGEWIARTTLSNGKVTTIRMEQMMRWVDEQMGGGFFEESQE